jgi:shikimate kinase
MRIYLVGFMGSGKTTTGKRLAKALGFPFIDLDHAIEQEYRKSIPEIFKQYDEGVFRLLEKNMLHKVSELNPTAIISTGGGTPCFFDNMEYILNNGLAIYLHLEIPVLVQRILKSHTRRPLVLSKDEDELQSRVEELLGKRNPFYRQADIHIDARSLRIESLLNTLINSPKFIALPGV